MDNNPFRPEWQQSGTNSDSLSSSGAQYQQCYPLDKKNPFYSTGECTEQPPPPYANNYGLSPFQLHSPQPDRWDLHRDQHNQNNLGPPLDHYGRPRSSSRELQRTQRWRPSPQDQHPYNQGGYNQPPPQQLQYNQYAPPTGPPPGHHNQPQQGTGTGGRYRPQIGFVNLPPRFFVWSRVRGLSGKLTIEMGPQNMASPAYASKESSGGSRTSFVDGNGYGQVIAEASDKGMFSSKSILSFNGYQTELQSSGDNYYFTAPVTGRSTEPFEWRRTHGRSRILVPRGAPSQAPPLAVWSAKADTIKNNAELGMFEFQGPVISGELGDMFVTLAVMALARIYQKEYQQRLAANGASSGSAAVAASS